MSTRGVPLPRSTRIAVIGAGTMGRGIARVAAGGGHDVVLIDTDSTVRGDALEETANRLERDVQRGRLTRGEATEVQRRIEGGSLEDIADCGLVIEAIVEDLDTKHTVFSAIETLVSNDAILATNTSSLRVSDIAEAVGDPGRVVGMHFFNPAPLLPLVEIVRGDATLPEVAEVAAATVEDWGKTPVMCSDTPGFIVNRIARPFYLEALQMVERGEGTPERIDAALRAAGFPMGPFELLDLIGIDINFSVSTSVHGQLGSDPRIPPSDLQRSMVNEGRLGRKTGTGFYTYPDGPTPPDPVQPGTARSLIVVGDGGHLAGLVDRLDGLISTAVLDDDGDGARVVLDGHIVRPVPDDGPADVIVDIVGDWASTSVVAAAGDPTAMAKLAGACALADIAVIELNRTPGLVAMRTVAMITTLAEEASALGVATENDIDTAMRLGVNHPRGPFEWRQHIGAETVSATLASLHEEYAGARYEPSRA